MDWQTKVVEGVVVDDNPTSTITFTVHNNYGSSRTEHSNVLFVQSRDGGIVKVVIANSTGVSVKTGHLVRVVFVEPGNFMVGLRNETLDHWWTWQPRADMSTMEGWKQSGCLLPAILLVIAFALAMSGTWTLALIFFAAAFVVPLVRNAPARRKMKAGLAERDRLMRERIRP